MVKAYGLVYVTEEESENTDIMLTEAGDPKYVVMGTEEWDRQAEKGYFSLPIALICKPHSIMLGKGKFQREHVFSTSGMTRVEKRREMYRRKFNTRGYPSGYGARTKPETV